MSLILHAIVFFSVLFISSQPAFADDKYTLIVEKNLFSPLRKKWESPVKTALSSKKIPHKSMLPKLKGTIITKNRRRAILAFGPPASPRPPVRAPARSIKGNKQPPRPPVYTPTPRTDNSRVVAVGDSFNDFLVVAVEDKNVTLEYEGEKIMLFQ